MKFFELAKDFEPAVPGGHSRALYMREPISMFTTVTEAEWNTPNDPSQLPTDPVLESMYSREKGFSKELAKAICARLDTQLFVYLLTELDLATQELVAKNIAAYGEHVDLADFAYEATELLVEILHTKAVLKNKTAPLLSDARIESVKAKHEKQLILRSRGCGKCGTPLAVKSHDASRDSFDIIFLDAVDETGPDDFAATSKPCAEKYHLSHTADEVAELRDRNAVLAANESIHAGLARLGLDSKVIELLTAINQSPIDEDVLEASYDVVPLQRKLDDAALICKCRDAMTNEDMIDAMTLLLTLGKIQLDTESGVIIRAH